jgi:hypothetical protein
MAKKSFLARLKERGWKESPSGWVPPPPSLSKKPVTPARAKKTKHGGEGMNSLEARYAFEILDQEIALGSSQRWFFESFRLRLAPKTFYTPDFMVIKSDGSISFREVKGFLREDASVKFKWAREIYPFFEFEMWSRQRGEWCEILPNLKARTQLLKKTTSRSAKTSSTKTPC